MNTPDSGTQPATPEQQAAHLELSLNTPGSVAPAGYLLFEEVGKGGMGVVYRARQVAYDRFVAIKYLRDEFDTCSITALKFIEEARITAQLQHPGITPIYEIGTLDNGRPFIAMKLVNGRALNQLLQENTSLDSLAIFEPVAQALGYAHSRGVLHRDLKPHNVMVGAFGEVQLMDWGLAKVLDDSMTTGPATDNETKSFTRILSRQNDDYATQYGSVKGTPAYMAPEQALGEIDRINERSDVFGLGGILCAMLTGRAVFVSRSGSAKDSRVLAAQGKLAEAFARLDGCGAESDVIELVKRCLAVDPAERPANGNEVAALVAKLRADAIERAKEAEIAQAREAVRLHEADVRQTLIVTEARRRQRLTLIGAATVAAVLVAGIIGTTIGLNRAEEKTTLANEKTTFAETKEREATTEKQTAIKDRDLADLALEQSSKVLDAMTSELTGDSLATQKTLSTEQKKFLEQAVSYYESLSRVGERDNVKSQERIAKAASGLGRIQQKLGNQSQAKKNTRSRSPSENGSYLNNPGC